MSVPSGNDEQDQADMRRLVAGHDAVLNELMARHAERLFHYLLRLLQNETEAADLAHETFVRVYQHRTRYNGKAKFSTWLYTIATNLARDLKRGRARHPHVSIHAPQSSSTGDYSEVLPDQSAGPAEALQHEEQAAIVRRAVAALSEELRIPLVLAEYENKSHAEIGAILNCSAKAVEMRLYRARAELRTRLKRFLES
jgi:RNA polymerase sigma-70 factor (ECF subfamily)